MKMTRLLGILLIFALSAQARAHASDADKTAGEVLTLSGAEAGLCVHLECGDGRLLEALARDGGFLAHGLTSDAASTAAIRKRFADDGLAGVASVESLPLDRLPYADNLVNLLVADDLPRLLKGGLTPAEILRVLRPNGAACLGVPPAKRKEIESQMATAGVKGFRFEQKSRLWLILKKSQPAGMDEWTHWNHGPDGNPVSMDQLIERPNQIQWIAGQHWSNDRINAVPGRGAALGVRSAGGRNYYVMGKGPFSKAGDQLVARDAFNGVMLWAQHILNLRHRLMVASGNEVYLCRGDEVVALDGATGKLVRSYGKAAGCQCLILAEGLLLSFESKELRAFDAATGKQKWSSPAAAGVKAAVVKGGKVFFTRGDLVCMDLADGAVKWKKNVRRIGGVVFAFNDMLLLRGGRKGAKTKYGLEYTALSAKDGAKAWSFTCDRPAGRYTEAYFAGGLVWVQSYDDRAKRKNDGFHNPKGGVSYKWDGLDPKTGTVKRSFLAPVMLSFACYPHFATDRFQIGIRPLYFTEWKTGKVTRFETTRQACQSNCGLAYGMYLGLYTESPMCNCVRAALSGISAHASDGKTIDGAVKMEEKGRLEIGPAAPPKSGSVPAGGDWPMYRRDMRRRAAAPGKIRAKQLAVLWTKKLLPAPKDAPGDDSVLRNDWLLNKVSGSPVTQPTAAGGKVFVSFTHAKQVVALDARSGEMAWRFLAPGRLDTPPSIHRGLCLFGCNDGSVYCLRADDGKLVWRFRAAPAERRIVAYGQVESAWPVVGGVLLVGDLAYVVAGRTTESDGGLYVHALDVTTGKCLWTGRRVKPDDGPIGAWNLRAHKNDYNGPSDVLSSDGATTLAIAGHPHGRFDLKSGRKVSGARGGFGWMRSQHAGVMGTHHAPRASSGLGTLHYRQTRDKKTKVRHYYIAMSGKRGWKIELTKPAIYVEALVLADDVGLAAVSSGPAAPGGELWALSPKDGSRLATHPLPAAPAFDGLAIAKEKVFLTLQDGTVMCLGRK